MSGSETAGHVGPAAPGAPALEVRVLGPVEVACHGQPVDIGGVKARALIARLLIDRGLVVSVDRLVDSLWSDHEGDGAEVALRSTISRCPQAPTRRRCARGPDRDPRPRVHPGRTGRGDRRPPLRTAGSRGAPPVVQATAQRGDPSAEGGAGSLARAGLQRGQGRALRVAEARRLEELLLAVTEARIDAELTAGRHESLIGELESLTAANPMRERLWSQRMLALYRCGRQAEALRVFGDLRSILVSELGIDPGHDVTWMEHAILTQDPGLDFPVPPEREDEGVGETPEANPTAGYRFRTPSAANEIPFVGRTQESAVLGDWWASVRAGEGRLLLVDGDPGIGKTRLAVELARAVDADGALVLWGRCDEDPVAPFQPFAEALGRYFQSVSADRISHMPDWQLTELSRLVLRLSEYAPVRRGGGRRAESGRYRFFEAVTATLDELVGTAGHAAGRRRPAPGRPTHAVAPARHVLQSIDDARFGIIGIYIRHRGATEPPPARHAGGLPLGSPRRGRCTCRDSVAARSRSWPSGGRRSPQTSFPSSAD